MNDTTQRPAGPAGPNDSPSDGSNDGSNDSSNVGSNAGSLAGSLAGAFAGPYGGDEHGLICGFWIHPDRPTEALPTLAQAQARLSQPDGGYLWLHLNLAHAGALPWLRRNAALAESFDEAQQQGSRSSRIERVGEHLFAVLNDVTFDFAFDVGDVSTLWMQVSEHLVLSVRRAPLRSVDRLRMAIKRGDRPRSSVALLDHLLRDQADELQRIVRQATERVDDIEDALLAGRHAGHGSEVAALRRLMVRLQRLLAPEPSALLRMLSNPPEWVAERDKQQLQQASEEFALVLRDIQALQERIRAVQDETSARVAQENNQTLYVLTMVTVLALPINLISGLFGMNVGGLPLLAHPHGFWVVVGLIVLLTGLVTLLLLKATGRRKSRPRPPGSSGRPRPSPSPPPSPSASELEERGQLVQVVVEVGQAVVAAFQQLDPARRVAGVHLAPVEDLVALGDDRQHPFRMRKRADVQRDEFLDELGPEEEVLLRVLPAGLLADVVREIAGRIHGRIQQHGPRTGALRHPGRIEAAKRTAHDRHRVARPVADQRVDERHRLARRRRQLRADEHQVRTPFRRPARHPQGLGRTRRRAEAVQVEEVGATGGGGRGRCARRGRGKRGGRRGTHGGPV